MHSSSTPSQRQLRAGELIRHALAEMFIRGETGDPELERLGVSILEVTITPDLRQATAYVRPLVTGQGDAVLQALERNRKYIRGLITPQVAMKFMPDLKFRLDTTADHASKIDRLLASPAVARDLKHDS
jgi:ribosome-binding factor A